MKIKIGTVIENHLIYAIYGAYFSDQMDAECEYASRCFPWFSDNVLFTANEDDDEVEEADEKTA